MVFQAAVSAVVVAVDFSYCDGVWREPLLQQGELDFSPANERSNRKWALAPVIAKLATKRGLEISKTIEEKMQAPARHTRQTSH